MKKPLLFVIAVIFLGACYFIGEVVKGDIFHPTSYENNASLIACIFLLGLGIGITMYENHFKPIKKTDS